jgi:hypothetical protein
MSMIRTRTGVLNQLRCVKTALHDAGQPEASNGAVHRQWANDLCERLAPFALPSGYANC